MLQKGIKICASTWILHTYSVRVSKLIAHNPIAVLATLLLMSYTKILKIIIDVYSSAKLEYPDNKTVTVYVWLKDGNVPYLQSWHLLLTVVTSLVFVFLFRLQTLPFFRQETHMRSLNRLKPLLDSYWIPIMPHATSTPAAGLGSCYWFAVLSILYSLLQMQIGAFMQLSLHLSSLD